MTERFTGFEVDALTLARRLLGQRLVRVERGARRAGTIVEVEAYLGVEDRAAHAFGGHRSPRNESMYLAGGHAYVYFTYGMHHCMNVVAGRPGEPVAVLVRALEPAEGLDAMRRRRPAARRERDLCSGPGKLAQALGVDRSLDGIDLRTDDRLFIERTRSRALPDRLVTRATRIGVDYAGEWASRPLRLFISGNPHVSRTRPGSKVAVGKG